MLRLNELCRFHGSIFLESSDARARLAARCLVFGSAPSATIRFGRTFAVLVMGVALLMSSRLEAAEDADALGAVTNLCFTVDLSLARAVRADEGYTVFAAECIRMLTAPKFQPRIADRIKEELQAIRSDGRQCVVLSAYIEVGIPPGAIEFDNRATLYPFSVLRVESHVRDPVRFMRRYIGPAPSIERRTTVIDEAPHELAYTIWCNVVPKEPDRLGKSAKTSERDTLPRSRVTLICLTRAAEDSQAMIELRSIEMNEKNGKWIDVPLQES
jgi:hypothetical protein